MDKQNNGKNSKKKITKTDPDVADNVDAYSRVFRQALQAVKVMGKSKKKDTK
jgi:hypothetical protein